MGRKNAKDRHHIIPQSRGGTNEASNLTWVNKRKHATYHVLFCNKTPDEIIDFLVGYFWNGQWEWVEKALAKRRNNEDLKM